MAGEGDGGCSEGRNKASLKEAGSKKGWQGIPKRVRETSPEKEISSKLHFWGLIFSTVKAHMLFSSPLSPLYNCRNAARRDSSLDDGRGVKKKKGEEFVGFQK